MLANLEARYREDQEALSARWVDAFAEQVENGR